MKSEIKIDYVDRGYDYSGGLEPVIRIEIKNSDDPRDKLISALFQSVRSNFLQFEHTNYKSVATSEGLPDAEKTILLFKPDTENNYFNVLNNSDAFREWLTSENIQWKPNEHYTLVRMDVTESILGAIYQTFELGARWGKYKELNEPK